MARFSPALALTPLERNLPLASCFALGRLVMFWMSRPRTHTHHKPHCRPAADSFDGPSLDGRSFRLAETLPLCDRLSSDFAILASCEKPAAAIFPVVVGPS